MSWKGIWSNLCLEQQNPTESGFQRFGMFFQYRTKYDVTIDLPIIVETWRLEDSGSWSAEVQYFCFI